MKMSKNKNLLGIIVLLICSLIWGSTFIAQKFASNDIEPFLFTGTRFILGGVIILPFALFFYKKDVKEEKQINKKSLLFGGIICGLFLALASWSQQVGIGETTVSKAGFITGLYTVFVPIFAFIFFKQKNGINVVIGVILATLGLYFISMINAGPLSLQFGDLMLLLSALLFTFQIISVDYFSRKNNAICLSCLQMFTCGLLCMILSLIFEKNSLEGIIKSIGPILYAGIMSSGIAYTFQVIGQKLCKNPTVSTLVMSLESVFSCIFGLIILNESLTCYEIVGCIMMFFAIIISQISFRFKRFKFLKDRKKDESNGNHIDL